MNKIEVTSPKDWGIRPKKFHSEWKSFLVHFHSFNEYSGSVIIGHSLESPEFTCNGQKWSLRLYPGGTTSDDFSDDIPLFVEGCCSAGDIISNSRYISLYLVHRSPGSTTATFEVKLINKFGESIETRRSSSNRPFDINSCISGWSDIIALSDVLDVSNGIINSNGTLTVVVSMKPTSDDESALKAASSLIVRDSSSTHLPNEPSWMKTLTAADSQSNEDVEVDRLEMFTSPPARNDHPVDHLSTHSDASSDALDEGENESRIDGNQDCRDDYDDDYDEESMEGSLIEENGASVSTLDKLGLPRTLFHETWKSFVIHFHRFAEISTAQGYLIESPEFSCNGQKWTLRLYPVGNSSATDDDGYISLYLVHKSRGSMAATFEVKLINKFRDTLAIRRSSNNRKFDSSSSTSGWRNIIKLSDVFDESKHILDNNGALAVVVSMKNEPVPVKKASHSNKEQNDLVLKKLIVKCLLRNELLPENTAIGSRGRDRVLKLQGEEESPQQPLHTRDPPESCSSWQPERLVRISKTPSMDALKQPPRPEEVRYQFFPKSEHLKQPSFIGVAPVQDDIVFSSKKNDFSMRSQHQFNGEKGLSNRAMDRRKHYKELLLQQQQLVQSQAHLAEVQRHSFVGDISFTS